MSEPNRKLDYYLAAAVWRASADRMRMLKAADPAVSVTSLAAVGPLGQAISAVAMKLVAVMASPLHTETRSVLLAQLLRQLEVTERADLDQDLQKSDGVKALESELQNAELAGTAPPADSPAASDQ